MENQVIEGIEGNTNVLPNQKSKRVSFRLLGVSPAEAMVHSSRQTPQLSSALRTSRSPVLNSPPKLKRRVTINKEGPQDVGSLKKELEAQKVLHAKQIDNMKSVYKELMDDIRKECAQSVEETKKKQWCANCSNLAKINCCWNTSYCDYICQKKHWASHVNNCERTTK